MNEMAQRLMFAVQENAPFDLTAVTDAELREAIATASDGPGGAHLFAWLLRHLQHDDASSAALEIIRRTIDPGTVAEIVAWLTRGGEVPSGLQRGLWNAFVNRAEDREAHYGVRAHALYGAMFLSQEEPALLRRFAGVLLDIETDDDPKYLRHAAKIIGVTLAHTPDHDLKTRLLAVASVDEAQDEAAMEIGMDALRAGLDATEHGEALKAFREALNWFEKASTGGDQRPDAELYRCCVQMLVSFQEGTTNNDVATRISALQRAAFEYAAYMSSSDRLPDIKSWLGSSVRERTHWSLLGMRLGALDLSLRKRAWLNAAAVIEEQLLSVYTASRSFLRRDHAGGVEVVIRPRISGALQRERAYLDCLDQWIVENADAEWMPDATALRREVAAARERSITRPPYDATTVSPTVAAILENGQVPLEHRERALDRVHASILAFTAETTSPIFEEIYSGLIDEMAANHDYSRLPQAAQLFEAVAYFTTLYVFSRHDMSRSSIPRVEFLFQRDSNNLPLEKHLQSDYFDFLMGSQLANVCQAEVRDRGGGRVDILFSFKGLRTVAELKRTEGSFDGDQLVDKFGLQTASYQTTSVTFGFLLVLDLVDRDGGQPHIREQISLHRRRPDWGQTEYFVALFRIQGQRKKPSEM